MKNCRSSCLLLVAFLFGALPTFAQVAKPSDRGKDHDMVYRGELRGQWGGITVDSFVWPIKPELPPLEMQTQRLPLKLGLMFLSGAADGMTQVIAFHPDKFFAQHPNANRQFWDNSISWRNKHKNGDPAQGPAFPFSRGALAWTTDAFHLFRTGSRLTAVAGLTIPLYKGSGKKLKHYAAEIGLSGLAWSAGFHTTYSLLYK